MGKGSVDAGIIVGFVALGGVGAYFTNYAGFKDWVDYNFFMRPQEYQEPNGDDDGGVFEEPKPKPKPTPTTFTCVSYPRCNSVSGDTARKECCCKNKCSLMKKSNQTMSPRLSGNLCLCNFKTVATPTPPKPSGPCALGKFWKLVNNQWTCATCTNTCDKCSDRRANCACRVDTSKISYKDANCAIGCNGYVCWTNYPCASKGARAQKCVKGITCAQARNAWLAAYGCKSSFAQAYPANVYNNYGQVPTIA